MFNFISMFFTKYVSEDVQSEEVQSEEVQIIEHPDFYKEEDFKALMNELTMPIIECYHCFNNGDDTYLEFINDFFDPSIEMCDSFTELMNLNHIDRDDKTGEIFENKWRNLENY